MCQRSIFSSLTGFDPKRFLRKQRCASQPWDFVAVVRVTSLFCSYTAEDQRYSGWCRFTQENTCIVLFTMWRRCHWFPKARFYLYHLRVSEVCLRKTCSTMETHTWLAVTWGSKRLHNSWQSKQRSLLSTANFIRLRGWLFGTAQSAPAGRCWNHTFMALIAIQNMYSIGFILEQCSLWNC